MPLTSIPNILSGSSINDITTALTLFCSQYSSENWSSLLRQELPELTDADIEWLCGLTETMELHELALPPAEPNPPLKEKTRAGGT